MKKVDRITIIKEKLNKLALSSLSGEELKVYFDHRTETILAKKGILVRDELEYLLSETGPGNLRIDPELLSKLLKGWSFVYPAYRSVPRTQEFLEKKRVAEISVIEHKNSKETQELILGILQNYLTEIRVVSSRPFVIEGTYKNVPVRCLIKNGDWVFPDKALLSFLSQCQKDRQFPVVIAKKISGVLFPAFKELSTLGLNLYKTYLPQKLEGIILNATSTDEFTKEIKYNNQFRFIDQEFAQDILTDYWIGEPLKNFFENIARDNIQTYFDNFLKTEVEISDDFLDTVSQFRSSKLRKLLIASYKNKLSTILELEKLNS